MASVDEIALCVCRLSSASVFQESDWPTLFVLVRRTVANLPAALYGPDSQITGHSTWTGTDLTIATEDWITEYLGCGIVDEKFSARAIVKLAQVSIHRFVLTTYSPPSPRRDCYCAVIEALQEFPGLTVDQCETNFEPRGPFPFDSDRTLSPRRRWITTAEARRALAQIAEQQPTGWTKGRLADVVCKWAGVPGGPISLESSAVPLPGYRPHDELASTETARMHGHNIGAQLDDADRKILAYAIPIWAGEMTLADASKKWNIPISTVHDRVQRLRDRIRALTTGLEIDGPAASSAFLEVLMGHSAGISSSQQDMK